MSPFYLCPLSTFRFQSFQILIMGRMRDAFLSFSTTYPEDPLHSSGQPHPKKTPAFLWTAGTLLVWLVMAGLAFGIIILLAAGAGSGLNAWERSKLGPLHRAACDGNVADCERLVKGGLPVDTMDEDGVTALSWAIFYCKNDVVRKLIELGADVNHVEQGIGFTPL